LLKFQLPFNCTGRAPHNLCRPLIIKPRNIGDALSSPPTIQEKIMTVCPIAIVSGCAKCPIFKVCPVKGVIGDYVKPEEKKPAAKTAAKKKS
jgi:hypothetical protein